MLIVLYLQRYVAYPTSTNLTEIDRRKNSELKSHILSGRSGGRAELQLRCSNCYMRALVLLLVTRVPQLTMRQWRF